MEKKLIIPVLLLFLGAIPVSSADAAEMQVLTPRIRQGETIMLKFTEKPENLYFDGKEIKVFPYQNAWRALIPVPLWQEIGAYNVTAKFNNGFIERKITISDKKQKLIVLPPPPKLGLTDKEITQELSTSNVSLRKTVEEVDETTHFNQLFGLALYDNRKISSPFGEIRQTGEESITHLGIDFDAKKGRAVAAINAGVVKSAYFDSIYGNSIVIDHGQGIYSLYMHMDSMRVRAGDKVKKGTLIGFVGETGMATGPHLHLSIKVNGVSIDPLQFVYWFR